MFENIPQELKALPQWINWQLTDGKKIPKIPGTTKNASSTNPAHWRTFDEAQAAYNSGNYSGIGFVFMDGGGLVGVDIDDCVINGELSELAKEVISLLDSYTEYSTSGTGIHIICKANKLRGNKKGTRDDTKGLEIYCSGRYFIMTGNMLSPIKSVNDRQKEIFQLMDKYLPEKIEHSQTGNVTMHKTVNVSDNELIDKIRQSKQGNKFSRLFDFGDTSSYANDDSRADQALAELIAWWTQDTEQIRRIMSASALGQREKWQRRKDYQDRTISEAINRASTRGGYNPQEYAKQQQEERYNLLEKKVIDNKNEKLLQEVFYYELSDAGNAERIKALKGADWLYCGNTKSWYKWNGKQWLENDGSELTAITVNVFRLMKGLTKKLVDDEKQQQYYLNFFTKSCNAPYVTKAKNMLQDFQNVSITQFDGLSYLLNMPDGTINLQTGEKYPHNKCDYITQIAGCTDCNNNYHGSLWERTLTEVLPDTGTREYFQCFCGYCLSGDVSEEKFLIAYGEGGKGKGTLLETIAAAMGDYATQIPVEVLLKSKTGNGEAPAAQLLSTKGKRLVLCSESGLGRKLDEAKIKWLTGGDKLTARAMYAKNPTTWKPTHKIIIQSNYLPHISDATDTGIQRRLIIIPFKADIAERDTTLKSRLQQQEELQHVMAWLLAGYQKWQSAGLCEESAEMKQIKNKFYDDNDLLSQWFVECCDIGSGYEMPMKQGKESFNDWLTGGKATHETVGLKVFSAGMESHGFCKVRKNTGFVFAGIALKNALTAKNYT